MPEVKLLFKKTFKSYVNNELISIIAGKKVFDIRPKVNWNKGSFAKLVINQIHMQTKTAPVVVFIGDDKTDEDVFRILENDVTIHVGKKHQSRAKYYLKNPMEVVKFLQLLNKIKETTKSKSSDKH